MRGRNIVQGLKTIIVSGRLGAWALGLGAGAGRWALGAGLHLVIHPGRMMTGGGSSASLL